ncbi:MAG: hypothetical protein JWM34_3078 [Ilumatobacteraceae bacterium]|nr:hypothetical protein [Ilumatobacteraceae bacterium]
MARSAEDLPHHVLDARYEGHLRDAWRAYGDPRLIVSVIEVSAKVSTNRVYRLRLDDDHSVIAKVSSYGSYFLFREDHDRIHRTRELLQPTRWAGLLADVLTERDDGAEPPEPEHRTTWRTGPRRYGPVRRGEPEHVFTFFNDDLWTAFYQDVPQAHALPRILSDGQVADLGEEMGLLHRDCTDVARRIPPSSKSIKSDAIHLLELLSDKHSSLKFQYDAAELQYLRSQCHEFLEQLDRFGYDDWTRIPVLIDWNLGNFSVSMARQQVRLFSRWDYDWFRIEPRQLDFYFLSRVASATGDKTVFSYSPHTLLEPRFKHLLGSYHRIFPMTEEEILFLREVYRFFILNYVVREGDNFFQPEYWHRLQHEAVALCLPAAERLDLRPLLAILD